MARRRGDAGAPRGRHTHERQKSDATRRGGDGHASLRPALPRRAPERLPARAGRLDDGVARRVRGGRFRRAAPRLAGAMGRLGYAAVALRALRIATHIYDTHFGGAPHATQPRETHSLPTEWACARGIGRRHVADGDDASRANEWPHSVCVCTRPSASHSSRHIGHVVFRVGRDRAHELRHARHALVERLLALALGCKDALALSAEVAAEGGES